jgi:hypothetical protein
MEVVCHISNSEIVNKKAISKAFKELSDGRYVVKIEKKNKRSLNQNQYYWGVVCEMVKDGLRDAGYREVKTKDDAHEIMKALFLKQRIVNELTDEVIEVPGSTAKLTTIEFNNYIEEIIKWAGEYLSIAIPLPNQQSEMFFQ